MRTLLFALFLFISSFLNASHIIGGVAQYEIIDASDVLSTKVRVTFTLYRDALSGGADFDSFADFGIYQKDDNGDYLLFNTQAVPPNEPTVFNSSSNFELESADYIYELDLDKGSDYIFAYQRCCRSELISNTQNDDTGFAIQLELFAAALEVVVNSPVVAGIPFYEAPLGENISYQLPIIQDTLTETATYFSSAFIAGGSFDAQGPNAGNVGCCDCVRPIPNDCTPPFQTISFLDSYSEEDPFGDENNIRLSSDGLISGILNLSSVYHYGIAIESRFDGQLLSRQLLDNTVRALFTSATEEVNSLSFELSPNPVTEILQVNITSNAHLILEIKDEIGQLVMSKALTKKITTLPVNHLGVGIYFATITNSKNNQRQTQKFIIK